MNGHQSELDTFSGYLVRTTQKLHIAIPFSQQCYHAISTAETLTYQSTADFANIHDYSTYRFDNKKTLYIGSWAVGFRSL